MLTRDALAYGLAGLAWAVLLYRTSHLLRGWRLPTRRALWIILLALALALTVRLSLVEPEIDRLTGVPNVARLFENGFILISIWAAQEFLLHLRLPPTPSDAAVAPTGHRHVHTWLLAASLGSMAVLFGLAPVGEATPDFWVRYAHVPLVLEYRLIFLSYLGAGLINLIRLGPWYARLTGRPAVALGVLLCVVGGVFGLVYVGHEAMYVIIRRLGFAYPFGHVVDPSALRNVLIAASLGPFLVGSTIPVWGEHPAVRALDRWIGRYQTYRRLYPLWRDLVRASPEIALVPPPPPMLDALAWRGLRLRLYRRVIEIWDGRLTLLPYIDVHVVATAQRASRAAGVTPEDEPFVVEACSLAAGMRAKASGLPAAEPAVLPLDQLPQTGGEDLNRDADILRRIAESYRSSPVVRAVSTHLEDLEKPTQRIKVRRP